MLKVLEDRLVRGHTHCFIVDRSKVFDGLEDGVETEGECQDYQNEDGEEFEEGDGNGFQHEHVDGQGGIRKNGQQFNGSEQNDKGRRYLITVVAVGHQSHHQPPTAKYHQHLQLVTLLLEIFDLVVGDPEKLDSFSNRQVQSGCQSWNQDPQHFLILWFVVDENQEEGEHIEKDKHVQVQVVNLAELEAFQVDEAREHGMSDEL